MNHSSDREPLCLSFGVAPWIEISSPRSQELQAIHHLFLGQVKAELGKSTEEHAEGKLVGDNDARMRSPLPHRFFVQAGEIATIVGEEGAPGSGGKGELILIPPSDIPRLMGSEDINATSPKSSCQCHVHVLIQVKEDLHGPRARRMYSSRLASISRSTSAWWS